MYRPTYYVYILSNNWCVSGVSAMTLSPFLSSWHIPFLLDMKGCICHFTMWQIHSLISEGMANDFCLYFCLSVCLFACLSCSCLILNTSYICLMMYLVAHTRQKPWKSKQGKMLVKDCHDCRSKKEVLKNIPKSSSQIIDQNDSYWGKRVLGTKTAI